jgi:hypothetical protein|tara:strand:- start:14 stop:1015 length:1002 start_codon:yes stop_codon:yes gene_type:complete
MKFRELRDVVEKMSGSKLTGQEISTWYKKNPDVKKAVKDAKIKQAVELALDHGGAMNYAIKKIEKIKRGLADHPAVAKALSYANFGEEKTLEEGTWAIPDSKEKMQKIQDILAKKTPGTKSNAKNLANKIYNLFGDDSLFDDIGRLEDNPDPKVDLRDIIVKHLEDWNMKFKKGSSYTITHAPKSWWEAEEVEETAKKRKSGNIKPTGLGSPMKGKLMSEAVAKIDPLDRAERVLNYKLKEIQYKTALKSFNEYDTNPEVKKEARGATGLDNAALAKRVPQRFKGIDQKTAQRVADAVKPKGTISSKLYMELGDLWDKKGMKGIDALLKKHKV